jgi:hypothetical protein
MASKMALKGTEYGEEAKQAIKGLTVSKTFHGNAWFVPMLLMALKGFGVVVTPQITGGIYLVSNIVLRFLTNKALTDK